MFVFAFCMIFLVRFPHGSIDSSMSGLAVSYGLNLNAQLSRWILSFCKLDNKIISIERIHQYCQFLASEWLSQVFGLWWHAWVNPLVIRVQKFYSLTYSILLNSLPSFINIICLTTSTPFWCFPIGLFQENVKNHQNKILWKFKFVSFGWLMRTETEERKGKISFEFLVLFFPF